MKGLKIVLLGLICAANLKAFTPNQAHNELMDIEVFKANIDKNNHFLLLEISNLNCKLCADLISSCFDDFSEIKRYEISLANKLSALEVDKKYRLVNILNCLKDEGYKPKIKEFL